MTETRKTHTHMSSMESSTLCSEQLGTPELQGLGELECAESLKILDSSNRALWPSYYSRCSAPTHPHRARFLSTNRSSICQQLNQAKTKQTRTNSRVSRADITVVGQLVHLRQGHIQVVDICTRNGTICRVAARGRAYVRHNVAGPDHRGDADLDWRRRLLVRVKAAVHQDVVLVHLPAHVLVTARPLVVVATVGATIAAGVADALRLGQAVVHVVASNSDSNPTCAIHQRL
mmetsp:Transcript_167438/g.532295  ORF Transcript_167438/g.532295 Transcript_167438/m.532295 type:complete len:232 (+) Transcript_167438:200-895(+)